MISIIYLTINIAIAILIIISVSIITIFNYISIISITTISLFYIYNRYIQKTNPEQFLSLKRNIKKKRADKNI